MKHTHLQTLSKKLTLPLILHFALLIFNCAAQLPTNNLTPHSISVTSDTNGVLLDPASFFAANSNALNAVVAGRQSPLTADVDAAGHKLTNASTIIATNINATNFTGNFNGPASTATNAGTAMNTSNLLGKLPATQISAVLSTTNGGLGWANTNWVPSGATYDNGSAWGYPQCTVSVISSATYFLFVPGNSTNNDQGAIYGGDYSLGLEQSGLFIPGTNHIQLWADNPNTTVGSQLYLVTNASMAVGGIIGGDLYGNFLGSIDPLTTLSASTIQSGGGYINGTRLQALANGGNENFIISTNTANGSTLSLFRAGPGGYADVNFFTYNSTNVAPPSIPTLWFAVGVGASGAAFPYQQPYIESYLNQYPVYYVGAGQIFGGFLSTPGHGEGDWVWFQDGTTNTPMFRISRANKVISNYCNVVLSSNLTVGGAISSLGGINTQATNTYSMTATGYTNANGKNVRVFGFTNLTAYFSNRTSRVTFTLATNVPFFILQSNECVVGTSCGGNIIDN